MNYARMCLVVVAMTTLFAIPAHAIHLDFYQVDWMADPAAGIGPYVSRYSDWGRVEISLSSADHSSFSSMTLADGTSGYGGFINIVTNPLGGALDWDIYNLPIFYEDPSELDGRLPQGVLFDLGVAAGTYVPTIDYGFSINSTAQLTTGTYPASITTVGATVNPFEILTGGDKIYMFGNVTESGGLMSPQAAMDFPGAESGEVIGARSSITVPETSITGVNEDVNGCAPGAVARSLKYMSDNHSNVNVPDSANTVYGELRGNMGTTAAGTSTAGILSGKNTYVKNHNLPIASTQTTNFKKAMETLKNGGDVEAGMHWGYDSTTGKSKGAHRAFVSEIQELHDASGNVTGYVVKTIDDSKQGDGAATNATHTAKFDANGKLVQYDGKGTANGAHLINFQTEDVHASTVVIEFPFGGSVTYPVPPGGYVPSPFGGSIPVGRPGESVNLGGIKIKFEGAAAAGAMVDPMLVANPNALPEMGDALTMNLDLALTPDDPSMSSILNVGLELDHVLLDEVTHGKLVSMLSTDMPGEEEYFLENFIMGGSFFDITYRVNTADGPFDEGEGSQFIRIHVEVAEDFLESVWFIGMSELAGDPDFAVDSFFDVYFDLEIMPEAYGLLPEIGEPVDLVTLLEMELTVLDTPMLGDASGDGLVNEDDVAMLAMNWLCSEDMLGRELTWADGDFYDDGIINDRDLALLMTNWTESTMAVPEPATIMLLMSGTICLLVCTRRRICRR